jgi:hypothetical protein
MANSERYFYKYEISAPDGSVVIGVRFVKKFYSSIGSNVVFLQPQVADLIDLGRVNATTARWMDLPETVSSADLHRLTKPENEEVALGNYAFDKKAYVTSESNKVSAVS